MQSSELQISSFWTARDARDSESTDNKVQWQRGFLWLHSILLLDSWSRLGSSEWRTNSFIEKEKWPIPHLVILNREGRARFRTYQQKVLWQRCFLWLHSTLIVDSWSRLGLSKWRIHSFLKRTVTNPKVRHSEQRGTSVIQNLPTTKCCGRGVFSGKIRNPWSITGFFLSEQRA